MTTKIIHCGFVNPEEADPIETLFALMEREPLEPWLAPFIDEPDADGVAKIGGNFYTTTFAFTIHTDDPVLLARFRAAIAVNVARPDYVEAAREREKQDAEREARLHRFITDARGERAR